MQDPNTLIDSANDSGIHPDWFENDLGDDQSETDNQNK